LSRTQAGLLTETTRGLIETLGANRWACSTFVARSIYIQSIQMIIRINTLN
jgi:hypothetical protein